MKYIKSQINKSLKFNKGFSLLESMVAIIVLMVGVSSVIAALNQSVALSPKIKNKVIAAHLAQEGIELVRNIRDNNWTSGAASWDLGLSTGSGCFQYDSDVFDTSCASFLMKFDGAHYIHTTEASAIFSRQINITNISANEIKVESIVNCGQNCLITLEDRLFDWK